MSKSGENEMDSIFVLEWIYSGSTSYFNYLQWIEKTYEPPPKWDHPGYTKDLEPLTVLHLDNRLYF